MSHLALWRHFALLKEEYEWINLSYDVNPSTPRWMGFNSMQIEPLYELDSSPFAVNMYTIVGQYGTHVDVPRHMVREGRSLDQIRASEMVMPLCVINKADEVKKNVDYVLSADDVLQWEDAYGTIPDGAFVVFQSGWSERPGHLLDNLDDKGLRRFPGWSLEAVQLLIDQRKIGGIGHETSDTELPATALATSFEVERYVLENNKIQVELLTNVKECPPVGGVFFCTFPRVTGGGGFPAYCFAVCPKDVSAV